MSRLTDSGPSTVRALIACAALALPATTALAQPDATFSDIVQPLRGSNSNPVGSASYSFGGSTCNLGGAPLAVVAAPGIHPVFVQNIYRLKDGRFQQLGMSWAVHEFCALQMQCTDCTPHHDCSALGAGCMTSDTSSFAGLRQGLGSRAQVNPATGALLQPYTIPSADFPSGKVAIANADLDTTLNFGALYFSEVVIVASGESNRTNNASHRRLLVTAYSNNGWNLVTTGATVATQPALAAWAANSAAPVTITPVDIAGDGRILVASSARFLGNRQWRYEYAVFNLSSDRAVGTFTVTSPSLVVDVSNAGFSAPAYHSGEPYLNTPWTITHQPGGATDRWVWQTQDFGANPYANALRWGTLYNFYFDADSPPRDGDVTLGLFKPGTPAEVSAAAVIPSVPCPADYDRNGAVNPSDVAFFVNTWFTSVMDGTLDGDFDHSGQVNPADVAAFINAWITALTTGC